MWHSLTKDHILRDYSLRLLYYVKSSKLTWFCIFLMLYGLPKYLFHVLSYNLLESIVVLLQSDIWTRSQASPILDKFHQRGNIFSWIPVTLYTTWGALSWSKPLNKFDSLRILVSLFEPASPSKHIKSSYRMRLSHREWLLDDHDHLVCNNLFTGKKFQDQCKQSMFFYLPMKNTCIPSCLAWKLGQLGLLVFLSTRSSIDKLHNYKSCPNNHMTWFVDPWQLANFGANKHLWKDYARKWKRVSFFLFAWNLIEYESSKWTCPTLIKETI